MFIVELHAVLAIPVAHPHEGAVRRADSLSPHEICDFAGTPQRPYSAQALWVVGRSPTLD
jgi:hypothetical protein